MSTLDLVNQILNDEEISTASFEEIMSSKVAERIDTFRKDVARGMFKEQVDNLNEIHTGDLVRVHHHTDGGTTHNFGGTKVDRVAGNRVHLYMKGNKYIFDKDTGKGVDAASKQLSFSKVVQEELTDDQIVEEILALDELSKRTLGSYINKAVNSGLGHAHSAGMTAQKFSGVPTSKTPEDFGANRVKAIKRLQGVAAATERLTKEQKETIETILEELDENFKIGDRVHLGFGVKGGAGFEGHIVKIDGDNVHVKSSHEKDRVFKGPIKNLSKKTNESVDGEMYVAPAKGDKVEINLPGHEKHGMVGTVVDTTDEGCLVKFDDGTTSLIPHGAYTKIA